MNETWLRDFRALRNVSAFRAAERRNITQPAFGRRIKALEDWCGQPPVDPSSHRLVLTPAGEILRDAAQDVLRRIDRLRHDLDGLAKPGGHVDLRLDPGAAPWLRAIVTAGGRGRGETCGYLSVLGETPDQIGDKITTVKAHRALEAGVEILILSGMPLLEEAHRFGELGLPHLPVEREERQAYTWPTLFDRDLDAKAAP